MKTIVLNRPLKLKSPWWRAWPVAEAAAIAVRGWWQRWRTQQAARRARDALYRLSPQMLRDIGAAPELIDAAESRAQAAQWRRLEMQLARGAMHDPRAW